MVTVDNGVFVVDNSQPGGGITPGCNITKFGAITSWRLAFELPAEHQGWLESRLKLGIQKFPIKYISRQGNECMGNIQVEFNKPKCICEGVGLCPNSLLADTRD